jgi:nicotinamidase-related amidase
MMSAYRIPFLFLISTTFCVPQGFTQNDRLQFEGRYLKKNSGNSDERFKKISWNPEETALIVCDMWDQHWCATATERVKEMAPRMNEFINAARQKGVTIVHAPSSTMEFYADFPQRQKMMQLESAPASAEILDWYYLDSKKESELPIDDTDGGCDDPESDCVHCEVWTKQIDLIGIKDQDCISDSGREINDYFTSKNIKNVILVGVHTNMCVLGRSFGIRSHVNLKRNVVLVRDLTDTMYNPEMTPKVSHDEGTALVIRHVEKYWCPTISSDELLRVGQ